jgi:hypothetical protein
MRQIIWLSLAFGAVWLAASGLLQYYAGKDHDLIDIANAVQSTGEKFWTFISPVLRLALLIIILISVAENFGLNQTGSSWQISGSDIGSFFKELTTSNGVQSFISVIIVVSLCVSAIAGVGDTNTLKDLALVVVGFYFGSRRKSGDGTRGADVGVPPSAPQSLQTPPPTRPFTETSNHPNPNSDPNTFPGFIGTAEDP